MLDDLYNGETLPILSELDVKFEMDEVRIVEEEPWDDNDSDSISKPAFWFLLVSVPQKPIKTNKNQETGKLGNPGPISQKPHMSTYSKNLRNQQKP